MLQSKGQRPLPCLPSLSQCSSTLLSFVITFLLLSSSVSSAPTNITIDDTLGDSNSGSLITYDPPLAWQAGQWCTNCTARVDKERAYAGTWHDATYNPPGGLSNAYPGTIISATAEFTGTAVYVYCIITRSAESPTGNTDMTFYVDDFSNPAGTYTLPRNGDATYLYDQLVFARDGLDESVKHSVRLESGRAGEKALALLDRIIYTTDDSQVTTTLNTVTSTTATTTSVTSSSSGSSGANAERSSSSPPSSISSSITDSSALSLLNSVPSLSAGSTTTDSDSVLELPTLTAPSSSQPSSSSSSDSTSSPNSSSNTGTIVGATLGSLGGVCIVSGLWWFCAARRKTRLKEEDEAARAIQPFLSSRHPPGPPSRFGAVAAGSDPFASDSSLGAGMREHRAGESERGRGMEGTRTYVTLPALPLVGGGMGTGTKTRMKSTTMSSTSPTSFDTTAGTPSPYTLLAPYIPGPFVPNLPSQPLLSAQRVAAGTGTGAGVAAGVVYGTPTPSVERVRVNGNGRNGRMRADGNTNKLEEHPYAVNVRPNEVTHFVQSQAQRQRQLPKPSKSRIPWNTKTRTGARARAGVSPFSPTPLYTAAGGNENDVVSPSTASATLSVGCPDGSGSSVGATGTATGKTLDGNVCGSIVNPSSSTGSRGRVSADTESPGIEKANAERTRRWFSFSRPNPSSGLQDREYRTRVDAPGPEVITPFTILRSNRRREPAPLDDGDTSDPFPATMQPRRSAKNQEHEHERNRTLMQRSPLVGAVHRPAPPPPPRAGAPAPPVAPRAAPPAPRPKRSRPRPLTRISEALSIRDDNPEGMENRDKDRDPEVANGKEGRDGDASSASGSEVRWQRKLVDLFTPSVVGFGVGSGKGTLHSSPDVVLNPVPLASELGETPHQGRERQGGSTPSTSLRPCRVAEEERAAAVPSPPSLYQSKVGRS